MSKRSGLLGGVTVAALSVAASAAHAAFFQLAENSPAGLGNAFAGGAAAAEDASTVWYNPAGLTRLGSSGYVLGGHIILPSTEVKSVTGSTITGTSITGGTGGDLGEDAIIPNFYYSRRLSDRAVLGFGVNVPYGLTTDYESGWVGRYHALHSEIKTINLNPAIGYKINDQFSVGGGVSAQYLEGTLTQAVDFGTICAAQGAGGICGPSAGNDGDAKLEADDTSYGYNLGLLWSPQADTRIGLAYRSKIKHKLEGTFDITAPSNVPALILTGGGLVDSRAMAFVTLPETISLSAFRQINPAWAVMGDVTRTRWSRLPELRIDFDSTQGDSVVTFNLKDVNRYSFGVIHSPGGAWKYRAGVALDKTPTPNESLRSPRLPDEDRTWFAVGADYQKSDDLSFAVSFVHIKIDDATVNKTATAAATDENRFRGSLAANYEADVNILSAQARWAFK